MTVLLGLCAVVVTLAIAAIAIATIRAVRHLSEAANEFKSTSEAVRISIRDADVMIRQLQELSAQLETLVSPLKRAVNRVEQVGDRAVRLSNVVLNEVEGPIRNTLALITGVRTGARSLMSALSRRSGSGAHSNGGYIHE
jgi:uncharacterized protein YoxC